jgi:uncharacterized membrane protein (GlpM family)
MYTGIMANGHIIADSGFGFLVSGMDHGAVLDIHLIAHTNAVHVSPHNSIEPNAAIIAHYHISHDGGIGGYKTVFSHFRVYSFYW